MEPFTYKNNKYQYVAYNNKQWVVVFHHNFLKSDPFISEEEARYSLDPNKYSILDEINDDHKFNGTHFEFLLYYPEFDIKIRWIQSTNPLYEKEVIGTRIVPGFKLLEPLTGINLSKFGGMVYTQTGRDEIPSLLNAYTGESFWYFAIGIYNCDNNYVKRKQIPAIYDGVSSSEYDTAHEVTLLLRIHNILVIHDICICGSTNLDSGHLCFL